jgi:23S rRNA pseudouridine1911/1915/1917 synthase
MSQKYQVKTQGKLLNFLFENLEGWSKKTVKQRLKSGGFFVNGEAQTRHDYFLNISDIVSIGLLEPKRRHPNDNVQHLEILHQDKDLIAINKPAGLLSVGTTKENKNHALALLRTQLIRNKDKRVQLWPVHRLDRETSGILLFATSKEMREKVMSRWGETQKDYLAIVKGIPKVD